MERNNLTGWAALAESLRIVLFAKPYTGLAIPWPVGSLSSVDDPVGIVNNRLRQRLVSRAFVGLSGNLRTDA
jgi:hypothetical protein